MAYEGPVNYNDAVLNLQKYIRRISYSDNRIPRVPLDGIYGSETRRAVSEFQRSASLPDTGITDKNTFDAIYSKYLILKSGDTGDLILAIPKKDYVLRIGDSHSMVSILQILLSEVSPIYDVSLSSNPSGVFDEETERAVKAMQKIFGLTETGVTDAILWQYLADAYSSYINSFE
ncbi:MAG: peptidoglycan-binding protein [Clostridia bacterium]|nr:peptidoglycan-binding protein [Clostridia bacterium]